MKTILLPTVGSSGDVYPVIALGKGLQARGERPYIVANAYYEDLVAANGLPFIPMGEADAYQKLINNPDLWHPTKGFQVLVEHAIGPYVRPLFDIIAQFDPKETVVAASGFLYGARMAREKLGTPYATLHLQPALFRTAYDTPAMGGFFFPEWLPVWLKRVYFGLIDAALVDRAIAPKVNPVRAELGLPPQKHFFGDGFHAPQKSIGLFPDWYAPPQPDWPSQIELTGFVRYDDGEEAALPPAVSDFLIAGDAPLIFTAGTAMKHGEGFFATAVAAAKKLNHPAILVTKFADQLPFPLPEHVLHVAYVPFSLLLPRAAALIHHGGIGTVAQALAAGVPQLVMPMSHDQPDNARRVTQLGVGKMVLPPDFEETAVAQALNELLTSNQVRMRCKALAQKVDFDRALAAACESIVGISSK